MGKSGSIIDLSNSMRVRHEDNRRPPDENNNHGEEEDVTAGAEPSGSQWKPPGQNGS
jgi:hypothetical protein